MNPHCTRCSLALTRNRVVLPDTGSGVRVLFVGGTPGVADSTAGVPFWSGSPAGQLLRRLVEDVGIPSTLCGYDNVVRCHGGSLKPEHVSACNYWTEMLLASLQPQVVVLLGQEALEAYTNPAHFAPRKPALALADVCGQPLDRGRRPVVIPTYHPSACIRNNSHRRLLVASLITVAGILGIERKFPPGAVVDRLPPERGAYVAVDTESSITGGELLGISFAWAEGGNLLTSWFGCGNMGEALQYLSRTECRLVMHNAKYDTNVLVESGVPSAHLDNLLIDDTMLMAYMLRAEQVHGSLGLKELTLALLGYAWTSLAEMGNPEDLSDGELGRYSMYDAASTYLLRQKLATMLLTEARP